jgi:hypothetical protein
LGGSPGPPPSPAKLSTLKIGFCTAKADAMNGLIGAGRGRDVPLFSSRARVVDTREHSTGRRAGRSERGLAEGNDRRHYDDARM